MSTRRYAKKTAAERQAQAAELQESIAAQVEALRDSEQWKKMLDFMGSFHRYSINNLMLIFAQMPTASRVAGFRQWQAKGRQVRKGEHGLRIFGYATKKIHAEEDSEDEEKTITYYPTLTVFDLSQTDPINPDEDASTVVHHLTGDDLGIFDACTQWLGRQGWTVERQHLTGGVNGYTTTDNTKRIVVDDALSTAQAAKTILHEAAHSILHTDLAAGEYVKHQGIYETEAESTAYVVAGLLGLDTTAYSIGYVAGWSQGDSEVIKTSATNVLRAAHTLADALCQDGEGTPAA